MIISFGSHRCTLCADLVASLDLGVGIVPPADASHPAMLNRARASGTRVRHVDFQWFQEVGLEKDWIEETYGDRSDLISSAIKRKDFARRVAQELPNGPLVATSGIVNDGARSLQYVRELIQLRDSDFPGRPVTVSFVLDRQGLSDNAVLARLGPLPSGIDQISLAVRDVNNYPSVWTYDDWYGWLRLIRGFVDSGYEVLLPYSDARGLVGVGAGALELGTGPQQPLRQLRPSQPRGRGGGSNSAVSYLSIPLLSILHGSRASVESDWRSIESHVNCSTILGAMPTLHSQTSAFDEEWTADGQPTSVIDTNRLTQHFTALAAAETAIISQGRADATEAQLADAATIGNRISQDAFKTPGSKAELANRLQAFRDVRRDAAF